MKKRSGSLIKKILLCLSLLGFLAAPVVMAGGEAIPPEAHPKGKTYDQWAAAWWQWATAIPYSEHPLVDSTGALGTQSQSGNVWFIGGSYVEADVNRSITIPTGKSLFFPILNVTIDTILEEPPLTPAEVEAFATEVIDLTDLGSLYARLDGNNITSDLSQFRAKSGAITAIFPLEDSLYENLLGVPVAGAVYPMAVEGHWLYLAPLEPGTHTLEFGGCIPAFEFCTNVTYNITVMP